MSRWLGAITRQPIQGRRTQWFIQCMRIKLELYVSSEENVFRAVLKVSTDGGCCERSTPTGSMPPDLRRRMHVGRTLFSSAELQGRCEQTTEFDLQHRNLRRARINMRQEQVDASLCTSSDTVWTECATGSQCRRSRRNDGLCHCDIVAHNEQSNGRRIADEAKSNPRWPPHKSTMARAALPPPHFDVDSLAIMTSR